MPEHLVIPENAKVVLPPHGFVHLQESCASDLDVVNAARVSLANMSKWCYRVESGRIFNDFVAVTEYLQENNLTYGDAQRTLRDEDEKLLRFLLKNKHGTPFEHNFFKFHVRAPIFVFREWHRHRIGVSINEESGRYSQLSGDFYSPLAQDVRSQVGKPGHYTYETVAPEMAQQVQDALDGSYRLAYARYLDLLEAGIAKEVARLVLPVGIYSQMLWSCNARSLMNFLALRNAPTAQREIRKYAEAMEEIFADKMPATYNAFLAADRVAP